MIKQGVDNVEPEHKGKNMAYGKLHLFINWFTAGQINQLGFMKKTFLPWFLP